MRPLTLDQYVGQKHLVGEGKAIRKMIEGKRCHSMILWGPPGTGKTTLAELIAQYCDAEVEKLSAISAGVKEIRATVERAKERLQQTGKKTVLFVDEVHRFNKGQQDAFLPFIEDGTVSFIGATTENPSFELNNAILSRARVYILKAIEPSDLVELVDRALSDTELGLGKLQLKLSAQNKDLIISLANGDGRKLLNYLELCGDLVADDNVITDEIIEQATGNQMATFDKGGDHFYDLISAFHKSVRGSAPDAALYWYCRILAGGGDPLYVARRLLAIATEDIGNADPRAMEIGLNAWDIFHRVGPSEGERAIAQATLYMAAAPKSNAVYKAFNQAKQDAASLPSYDVPIHLTNAPTELMKTMGKGAEYRYAHDEPNAYAAGEKYLPEQMNGTEYYHPVERGLEKKIAEKLRYLKGLDDNA
ncbi:replication-associated recombination protein A [Psychrosphaera saromensis]|jgi:putative ATPase|uniref:Replication-associated recombination protein A n=1 Tax=Psychrosphaera saromensis TaxID=716813 RepID=A0A2S7UZB8_9GAMM|nr:replication-associated recombination protein A [Psychrosphaera saromensis]PQJ55273.1 recombination factor protein RarA [Psychrosphaera saromensis]